MKHNLLIVLFFSFVMVSCRSSYETSHKNHSDNDKLLMAVAWYQHSAEMTALYYQGFNIATMRLKEAVAANTQGKPLAVVVDVDETMLDNSPFETTVIREGNSPGGWHQWTAEAKAKALPGALEFALFAKSLNVEIFYITNRDDSERTVTLQNLLSEGFPYSTIDHILTRNDTAYTAGNTSSKTGRRASVTENFEIVLLIGDNLNDFSEVFEDRSVDNGKEIVNQQQVLFGKKYIMLPNPMYGAWEKPLIDYRKDVSEKEKTKILKSKLKK